MNELVSKLGEYQGYSKMVHGGYKRASHKNVPIIMSNEVKINDIKECASESL